MGKIVKKVIPELLAEEVQRRGLHSDGQYESRKWPSAIEVAAIMVHRAHAAWTDAKLLVYT
jgi:hypothetical protein